MVSRSRADGLRITPSARLQSLRVLKALLRDETGFSRTSSLSKVPFLAAMKVVLTAVGAWEKVASLPGTKPTDLPVSGSGCVVWPFDLATLLARKVFEPVAHGVGSGAHTGIKTFGWSGRHGPMHVNTFPS